MTMKDLKSFLVHNLNLGRSHSVAVNREILENVIPAFSADQLVAKEVMAYQIDGTTIFVSDNGLTKPRQIIFVDLTNGTSFLQEIEH